MYNLFHNVYNFVDFLFFYIFIYYFFNIYKFFSFLIKETIHLFTNFTHFYTQFF